ncbi:hypothetical protein ACTA71_011039 [Dictyostelium dimigraforme]
MFRDYYNCNFIILFTLFCFITINIAQKENSFFVIKQWQFQNCTGQQYEFFSFKNSKFYSQLVNARFECYTYQSNVSCEMEFPTAKLKISSSSCKNGKTLEYLENFEYDQNEFNVISEFKDGNRDNLPIFNLGIKENHCVYGILTKRLLDGFEIKNCKSLDYTNAKNYTINNDSVPNKFLMFDCKGSILNEVNSIKYISNSFKLTFNYYLLFSLLILFFSYQL